MKRAILLDRDGVINADRPDYVLAWEQFRFLPGVLQALALAARSSYGVYVVTNQSAVGRGLLSAADLGEIHRRMRDEVQRHGGRVDGIVCCPHHPDAGCPCRKPEPGMLRSLAAEESVDLARSILVGDSLRDLEAGQRAGCQTILVRTGHGREAARHVNRLQSRPLAICDDLLDAVHWILHQGDSLE